MFGVTKVGDFGLARYIDAATRTHTVVNFKSPLYSAPEQWRREKQTVQTDLYQLGCTLYQILTGSFVFNKTNIAFMNAHLTETPAADQISSRIRNEVSEGILVLLNKNKKIEMNYGE